LRAARYGERAVIIGEVRAAPAGRVLLHAGLGSHRVVDVLMGELLPPICQAQFSSDGTRRAGDCRPFSFRLSDASLDSSRAAMIMAARRNVL